MKPRDHVTYTNRWGARVRCYVKRVHKDRTATVEAMFSLNEDGGDVPGYLGFKVRLPVAELTPLPPHPSVERAFKLDAARYGVTSQR